MITYRIHSLYSIIIELVLYYMTLTHLSDSDIYALCVAFPKSFAERLYGHTKALLEANVTEFANVCTLLLVSHSQPY